MQLVAQIRAVEAPALPGAAGGAAERHGATAAQVARRDAPGGGRPPRDSPSQPQITRQPPLRRRSFRYASSAARLAPSAPESPSETRVSASSESRVTSGSASAWASERISSRPAAKSGATQAS